MIQIQAQIDQNEKNKKMSINIIIMRAENFTEDEEAIAIEFHTVIIGALKKAKKVLGDKMVLDIIEENKDE